MILQSLSTLHWQRPGRHVAVMSSFRVPLSPEPFLEIINTIFSCSIEQTKCIAFHVIQMIKMTELKIDLTFFLARLILICMSETSTAWHWETCIRQYYRDIYTVYTRRDGAKSKMDRRLATEDNTQDFRQGLETWADQSKFCVVLVILVPTHCYVMGTGHQTMMIFYPYLGGWSRSSL